MGILELMGAPFVECLILVAIHTYLGIHVLKRRVIFVDLALAQIAALGTTVGFLFGIMPETPGALVFSMIFTFVGAAVFCATRFRQEKVPQEAIIGLVYAVSTAVAVIVVEKTRGAEHLKDILTGNLLWVRWSDVAVAAGAYAAVGLVHYAFRSKFLLISADPEGAYRAGVSVRAWDFLFYLTFGIVISLSVRVAGVLLVFVFLVAPAILALTVTERLVLQLMIGWGLGTIVTVGGLYLSWVVDLPSGPAVIALYGVALVVAGAALHVARAANRRRAMGRVAAGTGVTLVVSAALWGAGRFIASTRFAWTEEARQTSNEESRRHDETLTRLSSEEQRRRRSLEDRLAGCVGQNKFALYLSLPGPEERLALVRERLPTRRRVALEFLLLALADDDLPLLYREEGKQLLEQAAGQDFGYQSQNETGANTEAIARICDYVRALKRSQPDPGALRQAPSP